MARKKTGKNSSTRVEIAKIGNALASDAIPAPTPAEAKRDAELKSEQ